MKIHKGATDERGRKIEEHLEALIPMTGEDLVRDIAAMREMDQYQQGSRLIVPKLKVEGLEQGPNQYRYSCGVCIAFAGLSFGINDKWYHDTASWDLESPLYRVFCYHEVPRIWCRFKDEEHRGPRANEIYERCIETYRAAGWTGEAQEPNA